MLIEQAFHALPEVLAGTGYPIYKHEGGVVGAFALVMLQELNARNIDFPVQQLHFEKRYSDSAAARCDLYVSYKKMQSVYEGTLEPYGVSQDNWIEAKVLKPSDKKTLNAKGLGNIGTGNRTYNRNALLSDLLRLCSLTTAFSAKYLLHVYLAEPISCLVMPESKDEETKKKRGMFEWARKLSSNSGLQKLSITSKNSPKHCGLASDTSLDIWITNFRIRPRNLEETAPNYFWSMLTRIERFEITIGDKNFCSETENDNAIEILKSKIAPAFSADDPLQE